MNRADLDALEKIRAAAATRKLDVEGGRVRRTSSRFCLGVELGDYNWTELFGVGTDRFVWLGFKPNAMDRVRLYSENFPTSGVIEFRAGHVPPRDPSFAYSWGRFPFGVDYILSKADFSTSLGFDGVLHGNIPGVLGERMPSGGEKGAAGAIVRADAVDAVNAAVQTGYRRSHPELASKFSVHACKMVRGVEVLEGAI